MKRLHIYVLGKVQGVYFRYYTQQEARVHGVNGWVRNLPDGRVEAVFEGEECDVDVMLDLCKTGPLGAEVEHVDMLEESYVGEFRDFDIRR